MINTHSLFFKHKPNFEQLFPDASFIDACRSDIDTISNYAMRCWRLAIEHAIEQNKDVDEQSIFWLIAQHEAPGSVVATKQRVKSIIYFDNMLQLHLLH